MSNQPPAPLDDREWTRRKELLQAVLRYLTENGPTHWVALYLYFDKDGTGEIGKVLGHLAVCKHIMIDGNIAKITVLGTEQIQAKG